MLDILALRIDELAEQLKRQQECIDKSAIFFTDVISQVSHLVIQDHQNMNELGIMLEELKSPGSNK